MARDLVLDRLTKKFDRVTAVSDMSLEVSEGEFVCFLGPSGCGKTTTLRMIAGFETPTSGSIYYDGEMINDVIPQKRNFGIVFQSYALFPHMTVEENVGFGLKMRKVPKQKIKTRVNELLARVERLQEAVKFAREEANGLEVEEHKVGEKIFKYLFS